MKRFWNNDASDSVGMVSVLICQLREATVVDLYFCWYSIGVSPVPIVERMPNKAYKIHVALWRMYY